MSYFQLIHEYLDQGLDESQEAALFAELAKDSNLRSEFQFQLKMQKLAQYEMMTITPPAAATSAVFSNLGFSIPNAEIPMQDESDNRKYVLLLALFFALTASSAVYFMWNNATESKIAINNTPATIAAAIKSNNQGDANGKLLPIVEQKTGESKVIKSNRTNTFFAEKDNDKNSIVSNQSAFELQKVDNLNEVAFLSTLANSIKESLFSTNVESVSNSNANVVIDIPQMHQEPMNNSLQLVSPLQNEDRFNEIMVELKGISSQANEAKYAAIQNLEISKNWSIAGFYRLNEFHSFAVELGNEQFVIQNRLDADSKAIVWLGPTYRFTAANLVFENLIDPYVQVTLAATEGLIAKSNIGFVIAPNSTFSGVLGYELAMLLRGSLPEEQSAKRGLTFGFSYKFTLEK